ncbi:hypothetical protein BBW65_02890 [Helicobacter enhydrae]|uniref:Dihydroneopterin aldolase n=1 Tax=Helicobacter enhydrae TaxID=222136 RepID=A0A1B1U4W6_9HELI|nr:hypothetical protein [Helicobacter enhydrae]ANV97813.1 hypothetical protein BBW65_02890 [Helicobacter enhydrae]
MKIALECQSLLLQDTLKYYLSSYLCDINDCDFVLSDYLTHSHKPLFDISLEKETLPFNPQALLVRLEEFAKSLHKEPSNRDDVKAEVQALLIEFTERFVQIIKKHK